MKELYVIVIVFLLSSCSKETDNTFTTYTYQGTWRYEDLIIQNGIIHIDTTYTGELELSISNDSIKRNPGSSLEEYLAKTSLINDSLVYMRHKCVTCKMNSWIKISPNEKSVHYIHVRASQGPGGPARRTFVGIRI